MDTPTVEFLKFCREGIEAGEAKYGPVRADERNRSKEAIEETRDIFNYLVPLMLVKHPKIKLHAEWEQAVTLTYRLYRALRELQRVEERFERQPAEKGGEALR